LGRKLPPAQHTPALLIFAPSVVENLVLQTEQHEQRVVQEDPPEYSIPGYLLPVSFYLLSNMTKMLDLLFWRWHLRFVSRCGVKVLSVKVKVFDGSLFIFP
jgi:hypothetical protein